MSDQFPPQTPPSFGTTPPGPPPGSPPPPPGAQPPAPPTSPGPTSPATQSTGKMLAIVAAVVAGALALAGGIFAVTRSDDADTVNSDSVTTEVLVEDTVVPESSEPGSLPVETETAATAPPETEPAPVTEPDDVPASDPPTSDPVDTIDLGPDRDLIAIDQLLAWTSFAEDPLDEAGQQAEIDRLIAVRSVDAVAHPTRVSTICSGIPVNASMDLTIVWQFAGETVKTDIVFASPPGVGSCIDNEGEPLSAGSYQVVATNEDQSVVGFATTFVVGAGQVTQSFLNNSDGDICEVGVAPIDTAYYELFVVDGGALAPGELLNIPVATVEQDLAARYCDGSDVGPFSFVPNGSGTQNLAP